MYALSRGRHTALSILVSARRRFLRESEARRHSQHFSTALKYGEYGTDECRSMVIRYRHNTLEEKRWWRREK